MSNSLRSPESAKNTALYVKNIQEGLDPFLKILRDGNNRAMNDTSTSIDPQVLAEAEAAVALTLGTLRHISCRLSGKKTDTGLKMELDKMKKIVVRLMKKRKQLKLKKDATDETQK